MKNKILNPIAFIKIGFLTLGILSCTHPQNIKNPENTLRISHLDDIRSLDPAIGSDVYSTEIIPLIFETLYHYDFAHFNKTSELKPTPLLAADFPTFKKDPKTKIQTVSIPLRRGIFFHEDEVFLTPEGKRTRELTAEDFIYSWDRLKIGALNSPGAWIFDQKVSSYRAKDRYTLELILTKPYPLLLHALSLPYSAALPKEGVQKYGTKEGALISGFVGTGPFKVKEWLRGQRLILEKNKTYAEHFFPLTLGSDAGKLLPFLDQIVVNVVREQEPAWLKFLNGELDVLVLKRDSFDRAVGEDGSLTQELKQKNVTLHEGQGTLFYYLTFNMKDPVVGGKKGALLRKAISLALDRETWIKIFANSRGIKQTTPVPPGILGRPERSQIKYDYNVNRAKELLKQAGYLGGRGLPVLTIDMRSSDSYSRRLGEFLTQSLAEIGIELNVVLNSFPQFLEKSKLGRTQIMYDGWQMDYPDAENVYQLLYSKNIAPGPNIAQYVNPEFDKLYLELRELEPSPRRSEIIQKLDEIIQEEVPWALGFYQKDFRLTHASVLHYQAGEMLMDRLRYVRVRR